MDWGNLPPGTDFGSSWSNPSWTDAPPTRSSSWTSRLTPAEKSTLQQALQEEHSLYQLLLRSHTVGEAEAIQRRRSAAIEKIQKLLTRVGYAVTLPLTCGDLEELRRKCEYYF